MRFIDERPAILVRSKGAFLMQKSRAVCILGMHRSGTSVVSRAVNLLGAYLGEERDLLPPAPDNQEGVWERKDLVDFHNRVLSHFSRTWHSVGPLPDGWHHLDEIQPFKDELRELIERVFGNRPLWAWKDPRTTLLLPMWIDVLSDLGVELRTLYVIRNPLDVAKSLQRREGFPHDTSFGLWLMANLSALEAVQGAPTLVVSYDNFLRNWDSELRRCAAGLGITWPDDDGPLRRGMKEFLRDNLRHSVSQPIDLVSEDVPHVLIQLYDCLLKAAGDGLILSDETARSTLASIQRQVRQMWGLFRHDADELLESKQRMLHELSGLQAALHARESEFARIHRSLAWKVTKAFGSLADAVLPQKTRRRWIYDSCYKMIRTTVNDGVGRAVRETHEATLEHYQPYTLWIMRNEPCPEKLADMASESRGLAHRPKISLVTPIYNPERNDLVACIRSVRDQVYDNWELCLVDGGSTRKYVREVLTEFGGNDQRIKFKILDHNLGIGGNSNTALKMATGEYVGFLDHDDLLAPFALYEVVKLLNHDLSLEFVFSDEDKVPASGGKRYDPQFKSNWAPDTLLSYNYLCHFAVANRKLIDEIGGFREGYDGSQDYDLILRLTEKTRRIQRIPKVLYHWRASRVSAASDRNAKSYAHVAAKKAIADHLSRRDLEADVLDGVAPGIYRVKYRLRPAQRVSIIIPTKDKVALLERCVRSVLEKTQYQDFEILIVDNQSVEQVTLEFFQTMSSDARIRVLPYHSPFNFAAINNYAVRSTDREYLLFLNNDTEVISSDWMESMLEFAQRNDVGVVGAKLCYPDDTIQHAGTIIGLGGVADHAHVRFPRLASGYMWRIQTIQNVSAVTAACMLMRRDVFDQVGGFDERLAHSFNDVDLCLKVRDKGYLVVYTPYAELYHHESVSRGVEDTPERLARFAQEAALIKTRWRHVLQSGDPYYNPNLALGRNDFSISL